MKEQIQTLRHAYAAFNERKIDEVIATMHPDVDWPNAMEGTRVHGHAGVRDYWARQFEQIDSRVTPLEFHSAEGDRMRVEVHQIVHDLEGNLLSDGRVEHLFEFKDGLIARMDIQKNLDDPLGKQGSVSE